MFVFTCNFSRLFDLGIFLHLASDSLSFALPYIYGSGFYDGNDDMKNMTLLIFCEVSKVVVF